MHQLRLALAGAVPRRGSACPRALPPSPAGEGETSERPYLAIYGHGFPAWFQQGSATGRGAAATPGSASAIATTGPTNSISPAARTNLRGPSAWWSHRVAWLAALLDRPQLYIGWARTAYVVYEGLTYSRGRLGRLFDRMESLAPKRQEG